MTGAVEAASFAWRLTVTGAEAVRKAFGDIGKSANENLKTTKDGGEAAGASILALTNRLEGMSKQAEGLEKLRRQLVAIAAIGGAVEIVKSSLEMASSVQKVADDTGFAVKPVQELTYALGLLHVQQEVAAQAMQAFSANTAAFVTHNAGPAKQAYETLFGADAQDVAQKGLKNVDQFFMQVLDRLGKMKNEAQKIELARELFGRGAGSQLVGAANAGLEEIQKFREEAEKLGIVFDEDVIKKSQDAEDKVATLGHVLHMQLAVAIDENADKIEHLADAALKATPYVMDFFNGIVDVVTNLRDLIASVTIGFEDLIALHDESAARVSRIGVFGDAKRWLNKLNPWSDAEPDAPAGGATLLNPLDAFKGNPGLSFNPYAALGFDDAGNPGAVPTGGNKGAGAATAPPKGNDEAIAKAKAQAEAYDKLTYSLQQQIAAMGTSDREMFINTETRKLGAAATDEQRAKIAALAGQLYDEKEAWGHVKEAQEGVGDAFGTFAKNAIGHTKSIKDAVLDLAGSLENVLEKLFIQDQITDWFKSAMSGGSGGGFSLGSMFSSIGSGASSLFSGISSFLGFAEGGEFQVGGVGGTDSQLVAFRASPDETVSITRPGQSSGGGVGINIELLDARGADQGAVARIEQAITALNGSIEKRAIGAYYGEARRNPNF